MITIWSSLLLGMAQPVAAGLPAPPTAASATAPVPATRARAFLPGFFSSDDYPTAALRNEETGTVSFSLAIDRDGRVTRCTVTKSSGSAALDATTCGIIERRARFSPARDERGNAVADVTTSRIRWDLPAAPPLPVASQYQRMLLTFDPAGKIKSCRTDPAPVKSPLPGICERLTALSAMEASTPRGDVPANHELIIESGALVGGVEAARRFGTKPGEKRLHLDTVAVEIDASGKIVRCTAVPDVSRPAAGGLSCERKPQPTFVPLATNAPNRAVRQLVYYQVRYTRPVR